jgi:lysophospholipase L1-like esterase
MHRVTLAFVTVSIAIFGVMGTSTLPREPHLRLTAASSSRRRSDRFSAPKQVRATAQALPPVTTRLAHFVSAPEPVSSATCAISSGRASSNARLDEPLVVIVGASFTAGVGAGQPRHAWPYLLGHVLGWRVVAKGVPGAGYVRRGAGRRGPLRREIADLALRRLRPAMVILQAGHNDVGEPLSLVRRRVIATVRTVRRDAPEARLALLTVFVAAGIDTAADRSTDATIIAAARSVDPGAIIMNPGPWRFPRIADHLHPTPAGHEWIAYRVAEQLLTHGIHPDRTNVPARLEMRRLATLSRRCTAEPKSSLANDHVPAS